MVHEFHMASRLLSDFLADNLLPVKTFQRDEIVLY